MRKRPKACGQIGQGQEVMNTTRIWATTLTVLPILAAMAATFSPASASAGALAEPHLSLASSIYVEHTVRQNGAAVHSLEPATQLLPGQRVVTVVNWSRSADNHGAVGGFVLVNALPARLSYKQSSQVDEEVSVDGGHSWGRLGTLKIEGRLATTSDVTHLRWHVTQQQAASGSGQIAYAGIVR